MDFSVIGRAMSMFSCAEKPGMYLSTIARVAALSSNVPISVSAVVYAATEDARDDACCAVADMDATDAMRVSEIMKLRIGITFK